MEPSTSKRGSGGSKSLDERWAGFGYATRTGTPIWPEGCREGYPVEI
jgi:hypothetical protein